MSSQAFQPTSTSARTFPLTSPEFFARPFTNGVDFKLSEEKISAVKLFLAANGGSNEEDEASFRFGFALD